MAMDERRFRLLVRDLYRTAHELGAMLDRPVTPDGHMIGSLAECLAQFYYGLRLLPCSTTGHDGALENRKIEIKATQGNKSVSLRSEPEHLLVLRLLDDGTFQEVYNGPGAPVWALTAGRSRPSNGQYSVPLSKLRRLMNTVPMDQRIPQVRRAANPSVGLERPRARSRLEPPSP